MANSPSPSEQAAADKLTAAGAMTMNPYLVAAGLALSIIGGVSSRKAAKRAHRANQQYLAAQAVIAKKAHLRAVDIFTRESSLVMGQRVSAIARSGFSGGSIDKDMAHDTMLQFKELAAMKDTSDQEQALYRMNIAKEAAQVRAINRSGPILIGSDVVGTAAVSYQPMKNWATINRGTP